MIIYLSLYINKDNKKLPHTKKKKKKKIIEIYAFTK